MKKSLRLFLPTLIVLMALVTVFAACQPKQYTLSFETFGGTQIGSITAEAGEDIQSSLPLDPVKEGYTFGGWYDNEACTGESVQLPLQMPDKNIKFYAKWNAARKYTLTLDAGEANIENTTFELNAGETISEYLQGIEPVVSGLVFGNWFFEGGSELKPDDKMPSYNIKLVARYKANLSITVYKKGLDGNYGAPETKTSLQWYRETVNVSDVLGEEHFHIADGPSDVTIEKGDNKIDVHLDRNLYTVTFNANIPADCSEFDGEIDSVEALYEATVTLPENAFEAFMYRFAVWGTEADGGTYYHEGEEFTVEGNTEIFAIWDKGYYDKFGGIDILYVLATENTGKVLLSRPFVGEIEGTIDENGRFEITKDGETLSGQISDDGRFVYYREAQVGKYNIYDLYDAEKGTETIELDGYDRATYTDENGEAHSGKYEAVYDNETGDFLGMYRFINEENQGFYFAFQEIEGESVFLKQDQLAGSYFRYELKGVRGENSLFYYTFLVLDGFGSSIIAGYDEDGHVSVSAFGTYKAISGTGIVKARLTLDGIKYDEYTYKLLSLTSDVSVYIEYNKELDREFGGKNGTLKLDGFGDSDTSATYTDEKGETKVGMYVCETYVGSGNKIIRFSSGQETITFKIDGDTFEVVGARDYDEYFRLTDDSKVTSPYLIMDGSGNASMYAPNSKNVLVLVATGTYTQPDAEGISRLSLTVTDEAYAEDFGEYLNIRFILRTQTIIDGTDEREVGVYTVYVGNKTYTFGSQKLVLDDYGYGVYTDENGVIYNGEYFLSEVHEIEGVLDFVVFGEGGEISFRRYFKIQDSDNTFIVLSDEVGSYVISKYGTTNNADRVLFLDGNKGAILYSIDEESGALSIITTGTYNMTDYVYGTFTSASENFEFAIFIDNDETVFTKFDAVFSGDIKNGSDILNLDGYEYAAYYQQSGEDTKFGFYSIMKEGETYLAVFSATDDLGYVYDVMYFELGTDKTFKVRSYEWGEYAGLSAYRSTYEILKVDGHGNAELYMTDKAAQEETLYAQGTYEIYDETIGAYKFDLTTVTDKKDASFVAILATYDGNPVFIKEDGKNAIYVSNFCALEVDGYGGAAYVDSFGIVHSGDYSSMGETLIDFVDSDGQELFIRLDAENKKFEIITNGFVYDGNVLYKYLGEEKNIVIPDEITEIAELSFSTLTAGRYHGLDIETIDLKNVQKIGNSAFRQCEYLTKVTGKSVTELAGACFQSCIELYDIDMPELRIIGEMSFYGCDSIEEVEFDKATFIGAGAFSYMGAITRAKFSVVETVESMAFYDCPYLTEVNLGSAITEIQNEAFEAATETELLVVILETTDIVSFGLNVFAARNDYLIKVPDLETVLKYYKDSDINSEIAVHFAYRTENDGTFYSEYLSRVALHGIFYMYGAPYGVYKLEEDGGVKKLEIYNYSYGDYRLSYTGTIDDNGLSLTSSGYTTYYPIVGGEQYTFTETDTDKKLVFTMGTESQWKVDANWNGSQAQVEYLSGSLYLIDGFYRRSLNINFAEKTFSILSSEFISIVEEYHSSTDSSWILLSQNNEEKTDYSILAAFEGIRDEAGNYLYISDKTSVQLEGTAGNKKFTLAVSFESTNYIITVTLDEANKTFTYDFEMLTKTELVYENYSIVLWFDATDEISEVEFYYNGTKATLMDYSENDGVYIVTVLDRGYEAKYRAEINKLNTECTITQLGKGGSAWIDGVARAAVIVADGKPEFHIFVNKGGRETEAQEVTYIQVQNYYEVTADGEKFYVSYTDGTSRLSVKLVKAQMVYTSDNNVMTLVFDNGGKLVSAKLKLDSVSEELTGKEYIDTYGVTYYRFENGNNVYNVEPHNWDMSLEITVLIRKTVSDGNVTVEYFEDSEGDFDSVISFKTGDQVKTFSTEITDKGILITVGNEYYLLTVGANAAVAQATSKTAVTEDGRYRFTVLVSGNIVIKVTGFEEKSDNSYVSKRVIDSYYNTDGEIIVQVSGYDERFHCLFTVAGDNVSVVINEQ